MAIAVTAYVLNLSREFTIKKNTVDNELTIKISPLVNVAQAQEIPAIISTSSQNFAYDLVDELRVKNPKTIKKLIRCESNGENVTRPDSNGRLSRGILQFNDGGTWQEMSRLSGILGSPENPTDSILMADWMIKHGYLSRWSCAYITGLLKR